MQIEYGAIIGGVSGGVIVLLGYIFVTKWLNKQAEKREKRKERNTALEKHFEELKQVVIHEILTIISGIINDYGALEASTLRGNRTMDDHPFPLIFGFEERDEYQAFQAHYPDADKSWRGLVVKIWKQNEDVNAALKEIEEYISNNPDLPPIKPYDPLKEEKVIPETMTLIYQAIYSIAQGQRPLYDFSELHVTDYGNYQHISIRGQTVAITIKEKTEKCKSAFIKLQTSKQFRDRVLGLEGNTSQIMMSLKTLVYKLNDIYSYGLVSNKEGHKFEPNKSCKICNKLFN